MHDLKMRFAHWFNKEHDRDGHLWAEKFKCLLVESGHAARIVGAYIDLNPVRAGMVGDPKDYRWCGYAEALAGEERARQGLRMLFHEAVGESLGDRTGAEFAARPWKELAAEYRKILYWDGQKSDRDERKGRAGISRRKVEEVEAKGGKLSEMEMIRHRVRHFTDGLVIGSESFVGGVPRSAGVFRTPAQERGAKVPSCGDRVACDEGLGQSEFGMRGRGNRKGRRKRQ
jgi:hypothetical protein